MTLEELRAFAKETLGEPLFRGNQLFEWSYRHRAQSFEAMTSLGKALREKLTGLARIAEPKVVAAPRSTDGTRKLLLELEDGSKIEAVTIPDADRVTLCVSTQVGCALACKFCATGALGFTRNLMPHEIVDQLLIADRYAKQDQEEAGFKADRGITNVVLMGMGEPLMNADNVAHAIAIITTREGLDFSRHRITLSSVGILPKLWPFLERTGVHLAVSLHASNPTVRAELMPIDKAYGMDQLLDSIRDHAEEIQDRVTFEYVLLAGVNDKVEHAKELAGRIAGIRGKVNLLPFNPFEGAPYSRPNDETVEAFRNALRDEGVDAFVRKSRGRDIAAACGQLALTERALVKGPPLPKAHEHAREPAEEPAAS
jgi:23S rRNA (adenine2503-C2)-methyltransferase